MKVDKKNEIKDVQPIRTISQLNDMKWSLRKYCGERDYILFLVGINTGLRIGDLLKLQKNAIKGKKKLAIKEGKTGKTRVIHLENIYKELNAYIDTLADTEWLFPSRKGDNAITRVYAYKQLNKAAERIEIYEGIGTHTLRKTFGYWHYKQFRDVAELQNILNHSHPQITLRYIGVTDESIENNMRSFFL